MIDTMTRATFAERFDPKLIQPVIDAAARNNFIEKTFPATDIMAP